MSHGQSNSPGGLGDHGEGHQDQVTIIVNTRRKVVAANSISYSDVVRLAFDNPVFGPDIIYTITYRGGGGHPSRGQLAEGQSVPIQNGMVFNVVQTNKS